MNDATKPCSGIGSAVIPAWCGPSNGTNFGRGDRAAGSRSRDEQPGQRRARAHRDTGTQRPGDESAAGDPRARWPLGHCSFSTPATWDRFSDSPASCALSVSMTCGVHGDLGAPRRRVRVVLGAEQHPAVTLAQRPHGVEDLGDSGRRSCPAGRDRLPPEPDSACRPQPASPAGWRRSPTGRSWSSDPPRR